jgi:hypothetical protein
MKKIWFYLFDNPRVLNFEISQFIPHVDENNGGPCRIRIYDLYRVKVEKALSPQRAAAKLLILRSRVCSVIVRDGGNRSLLCGVGGGK